VLLVHASAIYRPKLTAIHQMTVTRALHAIALDCVFVPRHAIVRVQGDLDLWSKCVGVALVVIQLVFLVVSLFSCFVLLMSLLLLLLAIEPRAHKQF
jgi:hypothetical protein